MSSPASSIYCMHTSLNDGLLNFRADQGNNCSGSANLKSLGWKQLIMKLSDDCGVTPKKIYIVDLREECHGYVNGFPVTVRALENNWLNEGKFRPDIIDEETNLFEQLTEQQSQMFIKYSSLKDTPVKVPITLNTASTEETIITAYKANYIRIPVTDNKHPCPEQVDFFLETVSKLPPDAWLHFHCNKGNGRTSTFLVMLDIYRQPKQDLDLILDKCKDFSNYDFTDFTKRAEIRKARFQFLKNFHSYCNQDSESSFAEWSSLSKRLDTKMFNN